MKCMCRLCVFYCNFRWRKWDMTCRKKYWNVRRKCSARCGKKNVTECRCLAEKNMQLRPMKNDCTASNPIAIFYIFFSPSNDYWRYWYYLYLNIYYILFWWAFYNNIFIIIIIISISDMKIDVKFCPKIALILASPCGWKPFSICNIHWKCVYICVRVRTSILHFLSYEHIWLSLYVHVHHMS